jgi:Zn-dependent peptidase ImmA (M78 family)
MLNRPIEDRSLRVLKELSIEKLPIDVNEIALHYGVKIKEDTFDDAISGFLISKNGKNVIGINSNESSVRKRFTMAHELGHFILHSNKEDDLFISKIHFRDEESSTGEMKREREANAFAAGILMPRFLIEKELQQFKDKSAVEDAVSCLANIFNVSEIAMSYRLLNLGFIRRF